MHRALPLADSPPWLERRKVGQPRILRLRPLAIVVVPAAPVLVEDVAPAEVRERLARGVVSRVPSTRRNSWR